MAKKKTLLEKAQEFNKGAHRKNLPEEELELAIAWLSGDLRSKAYQKVMQFQSQGQIYSHIASCLKDLHSKGRVTIK